MNAGISASVLWLALAALSSAGVAAAQVAETSKQPLIAAPTTGSDTAAELPGRPDPSRSTEPAAIVELQRQIDGASAAACTDRYRIHKAQAWLNFAKYSAHTGAAPATQGAALSRAASLLTPSAAADAPASGSDELPGAPRVRDDLWRGIAAAREDGRVCNAPKMTAYCEVQLAWVGYETREGGWRHVDPYVRIAEDYCAQAMAAARPAKPPELPPVELPAPRVAVVERFELSASVLFAHDKFTSADMRSEGRAQLTRLAAHIKALASVDNITVTGHADISGKALYNVALSKRRAETVAAELVRDGVDAATLIALGVGSTEPVVSCDARLRHQHRSSYFRCLEPNRRVTIEIAGAVGPSAAPQPE